MEKQLRRWFAAVMAVCLLLLSGCSVWQTLPAALSPGESYVTEKGLYVGPRTAFWIPKDDNGKRYTVGQDTFEWHSHEGADREVHRIENVHWEWQAFPYTDETWNALFDEMPKEDMLFDDTPVKSLCSQYDVLWYQPLAEHCFLLEVDGTLWVVHLAPYGTKDSLWRIGSIHTLVPEQPVVSTGKGMGVVNPLSESDLAALAQETGVVLELPEETFQQLHVTRINTEPVLYSLEFVGEDGEAYTFRLTCSDAQEDISGMYYKWSEEWPCEEACTVRLNGSGQGVCLWQADGKTFSLAMKENAAGEKLEAMYHRLCAAMTNDA